MLCTPLLPGCSASSLRTLPHQLPTLLVLGWPHHCCSESLCVVRVSELEIQYQSDLQKLAQKDAELAGVQIYAVCALCCCWHCFEPCVLFAAVGTGLMIVRFVFDCLCGCRSLSALLVMVVALMCAASSGAQTQSSKDLRQINALKEQLSIMDRFGAQCCNSKICLCLCLFVYTSPT